MAIAESLRFQHRGGRIERLSLGEIHMPRIEAAGVARGLLAAVLAAGSCWAAEPPRPVGVVSHVKVLSDKVADVSSLEAWKKSFITDGMNDEEKAVAVWKSNVAFVYQDSPPIEFLHEGCVHDAIKDFNVYGYGMCCCASARVEQLARYVGLPARGNGINLHSVPEVFWDDRWHMLDASLVNYFRRPDGQIAGVADICEAVQDWLAEHPGYRGNDRQLRQFQQADGWAGWKKGPPLLADCNFYDAGGWWPAKTHGWYSTMQEYRRQQEDAVCVRVWLLARLRGEHPVAPRRAAGAQLVQQGAERQRHPSRRRRAELSEDQGGRRPDGLSARLWRS